MKLGNKIKKHEPEIYRDREKIRADLESLRHCQVGLHQVHQIVQTVINSRFKIKTKKK
jgi:hypothetical protein